MSLRVTILSVLCFGLLSTGCFRKRAPDTMAETFVFEDNELCVTTRAKKGDQKKVVNVLERRGPLYWPTLRRLSRLSPAPFRKGTDSPAC